MPLFVLLILTMFPYLRPYLFSYSFILATFFCCIRVLNFAVSVSSPTSNIIIVNQQANNDLLKEQKSLKTQLSEISRSYQETRIKLSEREEACDFMSGG